MQEEKRDRLALVAIKKKRYGSKLAKIIKEERNSIKKRTEERKELSLVRKNLWKRFREKEATEFGEGEEEAWEKLTKCLEEEEEDEDWQEWRLNPEVVRDILERHRKLNNDKAEDKTDSGTDVDKKDTGTDDDKAEADKAEEGGDDVDGAGQEAHQEIFNLKTITHITTPPPPLLQKSLFNTIAKMRTKILQELEDLKSGN